LSHLLLINVSGEQLDRDDSSMDILSPPSSSSLNLWNSEDLLSQSNEGVPSSEPPGNAAATPRRELIWKSLEQGNFSLASVSKQFGDFLDVVHPFSSGTLLKRHVASNARKTVHRCPGYNREEIKLTASISGSAVISFTTPLLRELCSVCGKLVQEGESFHCICGKGV
jgi:hypothetical protein